MISSRWAIVALLTALNLVNYLDRYLVNAVAPRFQAEFGLSDAEVSTVGIAFMLGYMITSPIFGTLGDRFRRKGLIAAGVGLWSLATALSGTTHGFWSMFAARVAVGVGEASYATLSPTIIDDLADESSKNRLLAVFYVAIPVGSALGYIAGGILEPRYGWRSAFFFAGGPGLLLALATLLIREPERTHAAAKSSGAAGVYRRLARNRQYADTVWGYVAQTFALGGFSFWAAPYMARRHCLPLATGNQLFGYITVFTGLVGTAIGGVIADRVRDDDRTRAALRVCWWSSAAAAPLALAAILAPSATLFMIALGVSELAIFASVSPTNAAVLGAVPSAMRANAMALSIFLIHLLGDLVSAPAIGVISDRAHDSIAECSGGAGLQAGMYLLPIALAVSAYFWWRGTKAPPGRLLDVDQSPK